MNSLQTCNRPRLWGFMGLLLAASVGQGCSMNSGLSNAILQPTPADPRAIDDAVHKPEAVASPKQHVGGASWYGPGFTGKKTASGEIFDETKFTAAHKTLPLGTKARVVHLKNGKSVEVMINDRGPYIDGRIIDLSRAAAHELGIIDKGVAQVRIELLEETGAAATMPGVTRQ